MGKRLGIDIAPIGWPGTVMALVLGVQAKWETGDADEAKYIAFQGGCYFSPCARFLPLALSKGS